MKLVYPAVFSPCLEKNGYTVTVPELPGCVTEGDSLADAIPIALEAGEFISLLALDMDSYAEKYGEKAVRKNLTIPAWLNTFAEKQHVNFSQVLTDALSAMYQSAQ